MIIATGLTKLYLTTAYTVQHTVEEKQKKAAGTECIPTGGMFNDGGILSLFETLRATIGDLIFLAASFVFLVLMLVGIIKLLSSNATVFFKGALIAGTSPVWGTIVLVFLHAATIKITGMGLC